MPLYCPALANSQEEATRDCDISKQEFDGMREKASQCGSMLFHWRTSCAFHLQVGHMFGFPPIYLVALLIFLTWHAQIQESRIHSRVVRQYSLVPCLIVVSSTGVGCNRAHNRLRDVHGHVWVAGLESIRRLADFPAVSTHEAGLPGRFPPSCCEGEASSNIRCWISRACRATRPPASGAACLGRCVLHLRPADRCRCRCGWGEVPQIDSVEPHRKFWPFSGQLRPRPGLQRKSCLCNL
jgi:hypothetical protein